MARTERSGHTTTNHDFIRQWVEERGGWPARVVGTGGDDDPGLIRVDFPGFSGEGSLERIEWDQWFEGFEANGLAFLHRDMDHGGGDLDRFNKLVARSGADNDDEGEGNGGRGRSGGSRKSSASSSSSRGGGSKSPASSKSGGSRSGGSSKSGASSKSGGSKSGATRSSASKGGADERNGGSRRSARAADEGARGTAPAASRSRAGMDEAGTALRGLLLHELGDLLSAEKLFAQATRALAREAQDPEVKARVEEHVTETERQAERVKEAFAALGERAKAVKCEAAQGLKEEHDSFKSDEKPSKEILSAFGLGSGLRVEHYEIAAYRSAIALAAALGETECARILKENLDEELAMASFLEKASRGVLKQMASGAGRMAADGAAPSRKSAGAASKGAASKGTRSSAAKSGGGSSSRKSAAGASSKTSGGSKAGGSKSSGGSTSGGSKSGGSSGRKSGGSSRKSARA